MNQPGHEQRVRDFRADLFAWTALHHFLPAGLVRELALATVAELAPEHRLGDLVEDHLTGIGVADSWTIVPKAVEGKRLEYLRQHVRVLCWANDAASYPELIKEDDFSPTAKALGDALQLGRMDFTAKAWALDRLKFPRQSSAHRIVAILRLGTNDPPDFSQMLAEARDIPPTLRSVILKHVGDLFADQDAWELADKFYEASEALIASWNQEVWRGYIEQFGDVVRQSRALATWIRQGPEAAVPLWSALSEAEPRFPTRLGVLNGAHETLIARMDVDDLTYWEDLRSAVLLPPLLLSTQDIGSGARAWQEGRFDDAYRYFWSTLRRQTALGSYSDTRSTKAAYAHALLSEVVGLPQNRFRPETFELGARLLVESGLAKSLQAIRFTSTLVQQYVSLELIESLVRSADRHPGVRHWRNLVLVELLASWGEALPAQETVLSNLIMEVLIGRARGFDASFDGSRNVGGEALKVLIRFAEKRPDLRRPHSDAVAETIVEKIEQFGWWTGTSQALNLAVAYKDTFSPSALERVVKAALEALQHTAPEDAMWPIVRPALQLLASSAAMSVLGGSAELGSGYVSSLLRYGVAQRSAAVSLLFGLANMHAPVQLDSDDTAVLEQVIEDVRAGLIELNSSAITDFVRALIVSARYAGPEPVREAIGCLITILRSPADGRKSMGFPYAYAPLLDLLSAKNDLSEAGLTDSDVAGALSSIGDALVIAWGKIVEQPQLLAAFSFSSDRPPDPTLVHNWTFATKRYLAEIGDRQDLASLLSRAYHEPSLSAAMRLGSATAAKFDELEKGEIDGIVTEDEATFYASVGRRLQIAASASDELRLCILQRLLDRCLQLGPNALDVSVFVAATPLRGQLKADLQVSDYVERLKRDWTLQRNLAPYLQAWRQT